MPIYEFDRIASDMTLNEIVAARLKKKIWAKIAQRAGGGMRTSGPFDPVIAAKLRKLRQSLTSAVKPKPPVTHMKRSVLLKRITEFNTRLDKIIHGTDGDGSPTSRAGRGRPGSSLTEFALLPALTGGIIGSGVGSRLTGKKLNPITGKWEDAQGNPASAPTVSSAAGAVAGAGAGIGVSKVHGSIMDSYGGAGGMKEAYRNLTRNAATQAGEKVSGVIGPKATTAIQDVHGIAKAEAGMAAENIAKKLKALRGAGTAALKKVFGARAPQNFVEFEARIDAIVFAQKKSVTEFTVADQPRKRSILKPLAIGAGLGAGTIVGIRAAGPVKAMAGGALEGLRARMGRKAGVRIPPEKVHDFLMKLHKAAKA